MKVKAIEEPFIWKDDISGAENYCDNQYRFHAVAQDSDIEICESVDVRGIIDSLIYDCGESVLVTCGACHYPECAGFSDRQTFDKTDKHVIWDLGFGTFVLDREAYEESALRMLKEMAELDIGWCDQVCGFWQCYKSLEEFKAMIAKAEAAVEENSRAYAR